MGGEGAGGGGGWGNSGGWGNPCMYSRQSHDVQTSVKSDLCIGDKKLMNLRYQKIFFTYASFQFNIGKRFPEK